jgi:hypothetical protein
MLRSMFFTNTTRLIYYLNGHTWALPVWKERKSLEIQQTSKMLRWTIIRENHIRIIYKQLWVQIFASILLFGTFYNDTGSDCYNTKT